MPTTENVTEPQQNQQITVRLRPTLFIALGGTGKEVLLRLRRRVLQNDWGGRRISDLARFPIASFVYFDTDTTEAVESDRAQRTDPLAQSVRFQEAEVLQKKVDVRHYMRELDSFPHIQAWLPEADLSSINTEKGAGQVRAISRLLFFDQFAKFRDLVRKQGEAVLNSIGRQHELEHLSLDIEHQLRVVVVCSAAGGTGSGSFIDVGLMVRSMRNPRPAQVDLVMLLPGGFSGANRQRVNANAFAAMMELEHTMRPGSKPPYVKRWTDRDEPETDVPYDDVYLVDTRNVLGAGTDRIDEINDMVADILFEDFGSSDFASRKRSVSVNQQQHKLMNYLPPLAARFGRRSLSYSCAYSSFGQATIDTKGHVALDAGVAQAAKAMMKAYFGVAVDDQGKLPTTQERDQFLDSKFHLQITSFEQKLEGIEQNDSINEYALVDELLALETGGTVASDLSDQIQRDFQTQVQSSADLGNWPTLVLKIFEQRRADVVGNIEHNSDIGPTSALIRKNRNKLANRLKSDGDDGIRATLFAYLDNRARGGLDYTIALVEQSKLQIDEAIQFLEESRRAYDRRADTAKTRFDKSLENLKDATKSGFIFGPDRRASERYIEHLTSELAFYNTLMLRRQSCLESIEFLKDMSTYLGVRRGVDEQGETLWEGAIANLIEGRRLVTQTLSSFDTEIALLRNAVERKDAGTYVVLEDDINIDVVMALSNAEVEEWARKIFEDEGGSRTLFPKLENESERNELINKLRGFSRAQLASRANMMRSAHDILLSMTERERAIVFEKAMVRAMPWINASFDRLGDGFEMRDRYKLYVAVENKERFERDFGSTFRQAIPAGKLGFTDAGIVTSGQRHRILLYCELSGIPLDTIIPLGDEWQRCYKTERKSALPLHNHRNSARFPNPVVPPTNDIERMRTTMNLFLRACAFGLIRRTSGPDAAYEFHIGDGDWELIGTERSIRAEGFTPSHRERVQEAVERFERALTPIQLLAAGELLDWTGKRAYAARKIRVGENRTERVAGLAQLAVTEQYSIYDERFRSILGTGDIGNADEVRTRLRNTILAWTEEVPDSLDDTDPIEVNHDRNDPEGVRAAPKRAIIAARFTDAALRSLVDAAAGVSVASASQPAPVAPVGAIAPIASSSRLFKVWHKPAGAPKGQQLGPFPLERIIEMIASGQVTPTTKLAPLDVKTWAEAGSIPEFSGYFASEIDDPEEDIEDPE